MDERFKYMMLSRLESDCDYYLGNGRRDARHSLWAGDEQKQIDEMRRLWSELEVKPEWLTMEQINEYAVKMGCK